MSDVKWIKITTDIFDDEKILLIETLPGANEIIVIWFKILCLAGKQNNNGVFVMSNRMPYTEKMLSTIFRCQEATLSLALRTFEQFGMIERMEDVITIPNWGKHQSFDKLEQKNNYMKKYMRERRQKQKEIALGIGCDEELETQEDSRKTNSKANSKANVSCAEEELYNEELYNEDNKENTSSDNKKPVKHKYGQFNNVLLSDVELEKLKESYDGVMSKIEDLSLYIESKNPKYKSHYATLISWLNKDGKKKKIPLPEKTKVESNDRFINLTEAEKQDLVSRGIINIDEQSVDYGMIEESDAEVISRIKG